MAAKPPASLPSPQQHILVVGAGVTGLSIAYQVARRGRCRVTVVDQAAKVPAVNAASMNGWGWANAFRKTPSEYAHLNRKSVACWHQLLAEIGAPAHVVRPGAAMWADSQSDAEVLRNNMKDAQARGYPCWEVSKEQLRGLCPELHLQTFAFGCYCPDDLLLDTTLILPLLLAASRREGAVIMCGVEVQTVTPEAVVLCDGRKLDADLVILAAGVGTSKLAETAGHDMNVLATKNTPVVAYVQEALLSQIPNLVWFKDGISMHCMSHHSGRVVFDMHGQTAAGPGDALADHSCASDSLSKWGEVLPALHGVHAEARQTLKPVPSDSISAVGWLERGLYVCTTHSGWTLAALLSQLVALEVADGAIVDELRPFRPNRPSLAARL